ncbi:uncharacterized protein B0P05DRAFT_549110 [Gilbertella persicaria]|uniref:uncharacterized protein n=1 Tax=Gilbertella persicaria TaxID=101096 RepID=UPI00221EE0AE|nr:uncharacterized protein B0P05DRAFT_549110 [Gilbertella persicaria]KAI8072158.1 hypothetical protein B0P05DRAFT_549110 [Gilbertella persicaria]
MPYQDTSIRFPPVTVSSKLSSKMLRKTPTSTDWIQQSYIEMIQDISYVPCHYFISSEKQVAIDETRATLDVCGAQLPVPDDKYDSCLEKSSIMSDEDDSDYNTITTTSTDYNRRNNMYRYYKEQELIRSIDEEVHSSSLRHIVPVNILDIKEQQTKPKKNRLQVVKKLIKKMRITAEKPFMTIDNHFINK